MIRRIAIGIAVLIVLLVAGIGGFLFHMAQSPGDPAFFEAEIVAFEEEDRAAFPAPGGIVFVGSSSIRFWDTLLSDMAPLPVTQRGFGGAQMEHVLHNTARVVLPYEPRAVVIFCGGNDVGFGKKRDRVVADYRAFLDLIHASLPDTDVWILSMKPSKRRWEQWDEMKKIDAALHGFAAADPRVRVVDTGRTLLGDDGTPDDVYIFDGLHLNAEGYRRWTALLRPLLMEAYGDAS
jgi:hypothetical protein